jgi:hypothetical protein
MYGTSIDDLQINTIDIPHHGNEDDADDSTLERDLTLVSFGPKGSFYLKFSDSISLWESVPPSLQSKLKGRSSSLPGVVSISISSSSQWLVVFLDGSFATSGFPLSLKLKHELMDSEDTSELSLFLFAPADGWILIRKSGALAYERLPTGLDMLLRRRGSNDAAVQTLSISGFGGWFIRFADGECEWVLIVY